MLNCHMFILSGLHSEHISKAHFATLKATVGRLHMVQIVCFETAKLFDPEDVCVGFTEFIYLNNLDG